MATRGRPRKNIAPENPDDGVATRGYVKCIARKVHDHRHVKDASYVGTFCVASFSWIALLIVWMTTLLATPVYNPVRFPEWAYWILVAFTAVETTALYDAIKTSDEPTQWAEGNNIDDYIKKYEKEKDKEC